MPRVSELRQVPWITLLQTLGQDTERVIQQRALKAAG